jgi:hypothetical protein
MELDDDLLAALQQAASDPARMLRGVPIWLPSDHRPPSPATPEQLRDAERRLGLACQSRCGRCSRGLPTVGSAPAMACLGLRTPLGVLLPAAIPNTASDRLGAISRHRGSSLDGAPPGAP